MMCMKRKSQFPQASDDLGISFFRLFQMFLLNILLSQLHQCSNRRITSNSSKVSLGLISDTEHPSNTMTALIKSANGETIAARSYHYLIRFTLVRKFLRVSCHLPLHTNISEQLPQNITRPSSRHCCALTCALIDNGGAGGFKRRRLGPKRKARQTGDYTAQTDAQGSVRTPMKRRWFSVYKIKYNSV